MPASDALIQKIRARAKQQGRQGLRRQPPVWQHPDAVERQYRQYLFGIVEALRQQVNDQLLGALPDLIERAQMVRPDARADAWPEDLDEFINRIRAQMENVTGDRRETAKGVAYSVSEFNRQQWRKVVQATLGVSVEQSEPWLTQQIESFARENAQLIKSIPDNELGNIDGLAQRSIRAGRPYNDVAKDIMNRVDVAKSRARLIARDQVQKLNSQLTELRQRELGVDSYTWVTSRDERVRPSHRAQHGKVFKWSDPPASTGHPGSDVQCRCYAAPNLAPIFEEAGLAKAS